MSKVEFIYNNTSTTISCIKNETMDEICKRFLKKYFIEKEKLIFYYSDKQIDFNSLYSETINESDKKNKLIKINISENNEKYNDDIKYSQIICPKCSENCKFNVKDYKINLYDCPNNHKIENILIEEFNQTQNINENKINCSDCKASLKINSEENEIYFCINCKKNMCEKCKLKHDKYHYLVNYEDKNYICKDHQRYYDSFCNTCNKNICIVCYSGHDKHDIKSFGYMIPNISKFSDNLKQLSDIINNFNNNINEIINKLNKVKKNANKYLKLFTDIVNNFNYKQINYEILYNLNNINTNEVLKDFNDINNEYNYLNKFEKIMKIYKKMTNEKIILEKEENIRIMNNNYFDLKINGINFNEEFNISNEGKEILETLNNELNSSNKNLNKNQKKKKRHHKRKDIKEKEEENDNINNSMNKEAPKNDKENSEDKKDEINFYENDESDKSPSNSKDSSGNEEYRLYSKINNNRELKKNRKKINIMEIY